MTQRLLQINELCKSFDCVRALDGFSCAVRPGEILGLIGPNGAGKTTLFNVLSGLLPADSGQAIFHGQNLLKTATHKISNHGIARTFQEPRLILKLSVLNNVLLCFKEQPGERVVNLFFRWRNCATIEMKNRQRALSLLDDVGLAARANDPAEALSYGQQKLLTIVMCLTADANLLLLDEPVAGIAPEMRKDILTIVKAQSREGKSVLLIEHDTEAVISVCDRVIFMDTGRKVCEGTPEEVRNDSRVIEAYLE